MASLKYRRFVLIVDDGTIHKALFAAKLSEKLRTMDIALTMVAASDGAQASLKAVNQKFDVVILDTSVPRIVESGFATSHGPLYVVGDASQCALGSQAARTFQKPIDSQKIIEALIQDLRSDQPEVSKSSIAVDVRVINAVIASTLKVLGQYGMNEVKMEKPQTKNCQEPLGGCISSVLDIVSKTFQGQLAISFDKKSFLELVSSMFGEEQLDINSDNQDAVGEINSIIYGNAKADLVQYGVMMKIPKIIHGEGQSLVCPGGSAGMRVPFKTSKGHFYIEVLAHPIG
jgi:CheY-specific phosphatase CheX